MSQIDIRFFSRSLNRHTSFKMYIPDDKRNYGGVYDKQNMKTLFILHGTHRTATTGYRNIFRKNITLPL